MPAGISHPRPAGLGLRLLAGGMAGGLGSLMLLWPLTGSGQAPAASASATMDRDALAKQVFGQRSKPQKVRQLDLPVRIEGREVGQIAARLTPAPQDTQLDIASLSTMLRQRLQDEPLAALTALAGSDGFGKPTALAADSRAAGLDITVDTSDLSVAISISPQIRRPVRIDVLGRGDPSRGYLVVPNASFSSYVNVRAALEYLVLPEPDRPDGRGPLNLVFEHASNWKGWVLETESSFKQDLSERWSRGSVRLVRDLPDRALRLIGGDLVNPTTSAQVGRTLGGVSVAKNFALTPYRSVQPAGQRDFVLEQSSLVEVQVNGRPTRSFRLEPGPYNLSNFPGTSGTNDVQIRITDAFGREQTIDFPFFFDGQLLADGVQEFAYTAGYPYSVQSNRIVYDTERATFSGFHRFGLNDRLTVGANLQSDRSQHVIGAEALLATGFGTFGLEPQVSFGDDTGYQVALRYRDFRAGGSLWDRRSVTAQLVWRDTAFGSFGTLDPVNDTAVDASLRVSQPLSDDLTATLGGRWRVNRASGLQDAWGVDANLRYRIDRQGSLDFTLNHAVESQGLKQTGAFISLRYSLDQGKQNVGVAIDTQSRETRLDWRYQSSRPVDQWAFSLDAVARAGGDRLQGSAGYTHQRFLASVRQDISQRPVNSGFGIERRTQLSLATALVYADGHFGITRPVNNSFAIVVPHPRLRKLLVGVDPIDGIWLSRSDRFGPPVVSNISAYLVRPLLLDVPDVPVGYDIGEDRPAVVPGYRTGTIVPVGTDASVSLDGQMQGPDGLPLGLQSGELRPVGEPVRKAVAFFTNRRGRFRVEAVRPGSWELILHGLDFRPVPVNIPEEAEGIRVLGSIRMEPAEQPGPGPGPGPGH
jgi:outer membrane usher protein